MLNSYENLWGPVIKEYVSVFEISALESRNLIISGTNLNIFLYSIAAMHFCLTIQYHPTLKYANCKRKKISNQARFVLNKKKLASKG